MSRAERFECESCNHSYIHYSNLLKHYREQKSHQPDGFSVKKGRPKQTAEDLINQCLHDALSPRTRSSRVKSFVDKLTDVELKKYCLQGLTKVVEPWEYLVETAKSVRGLHVQKVLAEFLKLRDALVLKFPELTPAIYSNVNSGLTSETKAKGNDEININEFIQEHKHIICQSLIEGENERVLFRETLMPAAYKKHADKFLNFACGVVGSLCVSQRDTQDILRNKWGKELAKVLGINIFPPKDTIVQCLNSKKQELSQQVNLQFHEQNNEIVVASINVKQYLEYLLTRPGMKNTVPTPNNNIVVYHFTDLAPWLKWSRFSTGITTLRLKVVEPYNLQSLVITCAAYLGADDYSTLSNCFRDVYEQITKLDKINLGGGRGEVNVIVRSTADGKQRRIDTGNSSARSTYPICDAPEHITQLGDMSVISNGPEWTVEDTINLSSKYKTWLGNKFDNNQNRREFAKQNLGNSGKINITGTNMENYYVGGVHLAMRSAESIATRIGQCAEGILESSKRYFSSLEKFARSVNKEDHTIKFDEIAVASFGETMPSILTDSGFSGVVLDVLQDFTSGLTSIYDALLDTPSSLSGKQFECNARIHLGFQFVTIFGTRSVTPSIKQIVVYTSHYIDKAKKDGELAGIPLTFSNFSDGLMETAHKYAKQGTFLYSGGRHGSSSAIEYQKLLLSQMFNNELYRMTDIEESRVRSSESKVTRKRKMHMMEQDESCPRDIKRKLKLPFQDTSSATNVLDCTKHETKATSCDESFANTILYDDNNDENNIDTNLTQDEARGIARNMHVEQPEQTENPEDLKNEILTASKLFHKDAEVFYINKKSAEKYKQSLEDKRDSVTFHADSLVVNNNVIFKRVDNRVSKEILVCKICPNKQEFVVEHQTTTSSVEKRRIRFPLNNVMGLHISTNTITVDIFKAPYLESKVKSIQAEKMAFPSKWNTVDFFNPCAKFRATIVSLENAEKLSLKERLQKYDVLRGCVLQDSYPSFNPYRREKPYEMMPILKDPVLVRAAQLAILEVEKDPKALQDVEYLVKLYQGITKAFRSRLSKRLGVKSSVFSHEL
ncbi:hypothetical protein AC249_AIPGENE25278 [Exaiptasia diaphana]|nr:hypothetical protein AC249_AIPGENE25278 [Exaiptasia diaphana]